MSYFKLTNNGIDYGVRSYPSLSNLTRIMDRNNDRFDDFLNLGNRPAPNQNPLVQFMQLFSVDVTWTKDYLINVINDKINQYASQVNFTSLYNRGKNHLESVYPESNHNTLLVVPFGNPTPIQINRYFSIPLNELVPLFPIYTTDYKQRWNIRDLIDSQIRSNPTDVFTIIQIDPHALLIGYWRWLKMNHEWGKSPHGYLTNFPLGNCYKYHNELVNFNYLNGNEDKINVVKDGWTLEPYFVPLESYTEFKNKYLLGTVLKSFTQFFQINEKTNPDVSLSKMIFPVTYKSLFFVQMSWVWSLASLGMVQHYIPYNKFVGAVDGELGNNLDIYFQKVPLQSQLNQIKSDVWRAHFLYIWNLVKEIR